MKLIVGLGNPGSKYNFTRHNFGFLTLDFYMKLHQINWQNPKMDAIWAKSGDLIFIKPQTFYNDSGRAVQNFCHFYKITPANIIVVCDDFDLEFGQIRYRASGSSGGNNGLKSISAHLNTTDFPRLRLGTNNSALRQKIGDVDFVLSRFTPEEKSQLPDLLNTALARLEEYL